MSAAAPILSSELKSTSWTVRTSPEPTQINLSHLEILKVSFQPVGNQMQGMCRFEEGFGQLLPLFRGLVLLGKPKSLKLIYEVNAAKVFFTFSNSEKEEVLTFLGQIIEMLRKEVRFKEILERVLENNKRFKSEQALLHSALQGKAWD